MSTPVYTRNGVAFRDSFVYLNADGTFNTGRVQGDFTRKLSAGGVGNQALTGITITEVDAVNNPGEYTVAVTTSGFVATNGVYELVITRTSDPRFTWELCIIVNDTGTSAATTASFTASSGNGRVTYLGTGMPNATVYITRGSTFITQVTTAANGDWGPVYLGDGTYTARAQLSGYTQGSGTITVSGATVTGPGTNIALAVGSTTNSLSAAQLWAYARRQAVDITGTKADAIVLSGVNDALDMVSSARLWPFLLRRGYLSLYGAYATGTITVTNGSATVTLASGTWPTWAATGRLYFGSQIIGVASRTSGTSIELDTTFNGTTLTGTSYTLFQNEYDLPDDLWRFGDILPGPRWGWGPDPVSPKKVFETENCAVYGQGFANAFAVANGGVMLWPYPTSDVSVGYTYWARPARLTTDTDIADWDPIHLEVLHRAIDFQMARQQGKIVPDGDTLMPAYQDALARATDMDKDTASLPAVGVYDVRVRPTPWHRTV